ncbi:MAG: amino acid ABC transporter permease [Dorea sp.]|nr:amino acid ABC transporter permease [Dorea sp.]
MSITRFFTYLMPYLASGMLVTIEVSAIAILSGAVAGVLLAIPRVYGSRIVRNILMVFGIFFKSIPNIVLLLILYFIIAGAIDMSPFGAGTFSLAIISAFYQLEIFRGALQSIDDGQMLAARAMGISKKRAILKIMLPQAIRRSLPAWANEMSIVVKSSSLVYVLGVPEMLRLAEYENARIHEPFIIYIAVALMYFILVSAINVLISYFEKRLQIPGLS